MLSTLNTFENTSVLDTVSNTLSLIITTTRTTTESGMTTSDWPMERG